MPTPPRRLSEVPTLREPTPDLPEFDKSTGSASPWLLPSSRGGSPAGFGSDLASARSSFGGGGGGGGGGGWKRESADIRDEERAPLTSQGDASAGNQRR